jgi:hypothetical protein
MTKEVPKTAVRAVRPMFDQLRASDPQPGNQTSWKHQTSSSFDWAIHPGGAAILRGAQRELHLTDDHIRASLETYHHYGNSSSPTVLIVLDKLRHMGKGRDHVVATSFGPGMMIEMCIMKRVRELTQVGPSLSQLGSKYQLWLALRSRLSKILRRPAAMHHVTRSELSPIGA